MRTRIGKKAAKVLATLGVTAGLVTAAPSPAHAAGSYNIMIRTSAGFVADYCLLSTTSGRQSATLELIVDTSNQPAEVAPGTAREVKHDLFQIIAGILHLQSGLPDLGCLQIAARLPERPLETGEPVSNRARPHPLILDAADSCTSPRGNAPDPPNYNVSARPPPLSTDGLRAPTRHRPF